MPSISVKYPTPPLVMHPQTINEPPPCFTVCWTFFGCNDSPSLNQVQLRPSDPNRLIFVSSEKITRFQSSTLQSWWALAKASLSFLFFWEIIGFFFLLPLRRPALWSSLLTVRGDTDLPFCSEIILVNFSHESTFLVDSWVTQKVTSFELRIFFLPALFSETKPQPEAILWTLDFEMASNCPIAHFKI